MPLRLGILKIDAKKEKGPSGTLFPKFIQIKPSIIIFSSIYFTENLNEVFVVYLSPGFNNTEGKSGWLGESG